MIRTRYAFLLMMLSLHSFTVTAGERNFPRTDSGYAYPDPSIPTVFPRDHGNHPDFAIEWWYLTGNLSDEKTDDRFAIQITFFRYSAPPESTAGSNSNFQNQALFLTHLAVMDLQSGTFYHQEKLDREGWNARADNAGLNLSHDNWSLTASGYDAHGDPHAFTFAGSIRADATLDLVFQPQKARVLFGENGVSRKGNAPQSASLYITFPRLDVTGALRIGDRQIQVRGQAWMDHEVSSNQLEDNQEGWDWVQMQLFDNTEVMAYRLRRSDKSTDPYSFFNWIAADGSVSSVKADAFQWKAGNQTWTSPSTGATYPIAPVIDAIHPETDEKETYRIEPLVEHAELPGTLGGIAYWEGAVRIYNAQDEWIGIGFLELTGYAQDLSERL